MEQSRLGMSGPFVSRLALGAMTFGQETDEAEAYAILDRFVEAGGTLVDTADIYANGRSEEIIGGWLRQRAGARDRLVIASKGRFPMAGGQSRAGLRREYLHWALNESLTRLGIERIDIYQAHGPDPSVPLDEFALFAAEAMAAGKVNHVGLSNFAGWQTALAHGLCVSYGSRPPVVLQPQYNLLVREPEWEIMPAAVELGMGTMAWGPLAAGWLTGKYCRGEQPAAGSRLGDDPERGLEALSRRGTERTWRIVDTLRAVAAEHGLTPIQVALAWVLGRPGVTAALVGARTAEQLSASLCAAGLRLDGSATQVLDDVSEPSTPDYPYIFISEITGVRS